MCRTLLIALGIAFMMYPSLAQKRPAPGRDLDIYWKSKHKRITKVAEAVDFQAGDTVADIGTASGHFIAAISKYTDEVTFFLEDIDSASWSRPAFDSILHRFSVLSGKQSTNLFFHVVGTEQKTALPHNTFHKVLIADTYHHFTHRNEMVSDVVSLLKPGGRVYLLEAIARRPGDLHHACKSTIFTEAEIINHLAAYGLTLQKSTFIDKQAGRHNKLLVFSHD